VVEADLSVVPGELVLIMGPSGSGKTTLLCMAGALLRPDSGSIHLLGTEITRSHSRELPAIRRDRVGFIFQRFNLLEALTAIENVEVPLLLARRPRRQARAIAERLLIDLGLRDRLKALPRTLSGGEQQRVAIARALANDPPLVLADEPTANVDAAHGLEVVALLQRIARRDRRAAVIVSHDERIRQVADRVLKMEDGRLGAGGA
jgi:putative ABC transport system ATP-binding protein